MCSLVGCQPAREGSLAPLQDKTIEYYKKCFGMKLLRYRDIPEVRAAGMALCLQCAVHCPLSTASASIALRRSTERARAAINIT
jgi:hypothetical protein